jgi:Ni/Fe-hydrogenase subunit HybB-like protein
MTDATLPRAGSQSARVTDEVVDIPLAFPQPRGWWLAMLAALALLGCFVVAASVVFWNGIGVWGNNIPVNWGIAISNYVWWLGIGHAGTLISAMLLLVNAHWRNALNRFAEAMTLFAVVCAGLYPILHLGRPWLFYWMAPYPNTMSLWPQFRSPLTWDFFAVLTYLSVSTMFWFIGIVPDLAAARDRARQRGWRVFFGLACLGWRGDARHWHRWRQAYALTAAIAVPLVVSVHSEISLLFAAGPQAGWNSTVFPPYFVLGAAFSGFAVVSVIAVVLRHAFQLENLVSERHLDLLGRLLLATGLMTAYGYVIELYDGVAHSSPHPDAVLHDRLVGQHAWTWWAAVVLNFLPLQVLWSRRARISPSILAAVSLSVAVGMWFERYMLLVTGLARDYLTSSWSSYHPSFWEWLLYAGMGGLFLTPFLLFVRFLPMVSAFEINEAREEEHEDPAAPPPERPAVPLAASPDRPDYPGGLIAAFDHPKALLAAVGRLRADGYAVMDAYTPFPVAGLPQALGLEDRRVPLLVLAGGIAGAAAGIGLQVWGNLAFPLNVGGRPLLAWPAFVLIAFELCVLGAVATGIIGMFLLNGLPRLNHPILDAPPLRRATIDRFVLALHASDPRFDREALLEKLAAFDPVLMEDLPAQRAPA